jgi:purine-nucleoside phosphorylase
MTPHIEAQPGAYAETVLMPGDPLRAAFIAENFLEKSEQVNSIRNCLGFTGYYKNQRISVQASGMGQPSLGIYATELFDVYSVQRIIRIGTCGSFQNHVQLGDLVVPLTASSDSQLGKNRADGAHLSSCCSYELLEKVMHTAKGYPHKVHVGSFFASDNFYDDRTNWWHAYRDAGVLGVDMETYYLYLLAMLRNRQSLTINIVSDNFNSKETLNPKARVELSSKSVQILLDALCTESL